MSLEVDVESKKKRGSPKENLTKKTSANGTELDTMNGKSDTVSINMDAFAKLEEPGLPIVLEFNNLSYKIPRKPTPDNPAKERVILNNVAGFAHPGELVAIMGPTGSGKTTLLNVLARRTKVGVTGDILANGKPLTKDVRKHIAYVLQDDVMFSHLTVDETLKYQALLRQPGHLSQEEKFAKVDEIIDVLNIKKSRNTIIGGPFQRGVSGGERKRVNIGTQMLSDPSLIFLDEPTSGLDTSTAVSLISTMKKVAQSGFSVLSTIHQPSSQIFELFDKLILLVDGNVVYFGPANQAVVYFESLGYVCPPNYNPGDFVMGLILEEEIKGTSGGDASGVKKHMIDAWQEHGPHPYDPTLEPTKPDEKRSKKASRKAAKKSQTKLDEIRADAQSKESKFDKPKFPVSWPAQVRILGGRSIKQAIQTYLQKVPIIQQILVALIVGMVWFQSPFDYERVRDHSGAAFFIMVFAAGFSPLIDSLFNFPAERTVIARERAEGAFQLSSYFFGKILADLPFMFILPIVFCCISYWMVGLRADAGYFFLFLASALASVLASSGVGLLISASLYDLRVASVSATVVMLLFMLIGGFYVPVSRLPIWFGWTRFLSVVKYCYDAAILTQFEGREIPGSTENGDAYIASLSPVVPSIGWNILILVAWGVFYRILAFISLKYTFKAKAK